jgi:hypothetical protein
MYVHFPFNAQADEAGCAAGAAVAGIYAGHHLLHKQIYHPCQDSVSLSIVCRLMKLAVPLALQSLASMLTTFISTTFVGHLNDPLALSAVVLSSSLFNVTGISITIGLASAMDTLCGQVGPPLVACMHIAPFSISTLDTLCRIQEP